MRRYINLDLFFIVLQCITHSTILGQSDAGLEVVERCHPDTLPLSCPRGFTISVQTIVLGETECNYYLGRCCPKPTDCTEEPSEDHRSYVHRTCNGRQNCGVDTARETIRCNGRSEFERITYRCIDIDECLNKVCSPHGSCTNTAGSFTCQCDDGYVGNGFACFDQRTTTVPSADFDGSPTSSTVAVEEKSSIINGSVVPVDALSAGTDSPNPATAASAISGKKSSTVLVAVLVVLVIIIAATVIAVLFVRHRKALKGQDRLNAHDDSTVGFRQLENTERRRDLDAAEEPLYELEISVNQHSSSPRVVIDNDYGDNAHAGAKAVYSEPGDCSKKLNGCLSPDLMEHDDGNTYDEVSFVDHRKSDPDDHVYGNVSAHVADDSARNVYSEAAPLKESAYNTVFNVRSSNNNQTDEDEYVMPNLGARGTVPTPASKPSAASGSTVYCAMERRPSEQSLVDL